MNIKQIKALAQILAQNDLSALEINEGETHIRLDRPDAQSAAQAGAVLVAPPMPSSSPVPWMTLYTGMARFSAARPVVPRPWATKKVSARM